MDQQKQTKVYFNDYATDWQNMVASESYNPMTNRHMAVLRVIESRKLPLNFLDVGCGTGQLCIEVASLGADSTGVDFAQDMVDLCLKNAANDNSKAKFICDSVFTMSLPENHFDVISSQGFIEYISYAELKEFLQKVNKSLKKGGSLALGSRNRLYNLHSLNDYTAMEKNLGMIDNLLEESIILHMSKSQSDAMAKLSQKTFSYKQPESHPSTGIQVTTRYQYSPAELIALFKEYGFQAARIFPVHYHAFPSSSQKWKETGIHKKIASLVAQDHLEDQTLVPYSSSYVFEAVKI